MKILVAAICLLIPMGAAAHTQMHFTLMQVERVIEVTTNSIRLNYEGKLQRPLPDAALPMLDMDQNGTVETSETRALWKGAADYLAVDLVLFLGRGPGVVQVDNVTVEDDGEKGRFSLSSPLEQQGDVGITIVDPAFLFPPLDPQAKHSARAVAVPPVTIVHNGETTSSLQMDVAPAAVLNVRIP